MDSSADRMQQLEAIASEDDFDRASGRVIKHWDFQRSEYQVVEDVLHFMERHPHIDYGSPGSLVHFIEQFYGPEYIRLLVESLNRRPTVQTTWMLNRVLNGTVESDARRALIDQMQAIAAHPLADDQVIRLAVDLFERSSS